MRGRLIRDPRQNLGQKMRQKGERLMVLICNKEKPSGIARESSVSVVKMRGGSGRNEGDIIQPAGSVVEHRAGEKRNILPRMDSAMKSDANNKTEGGEGKEEMPLPRGSGRVC